MANGLVDSYCKGCIHLGGATKGDNHRPKHCDYIGNTGHPRPCPAGRGCTVRETKKKKKEEDADQWD